MSTDLLLQLLPACGGGPARIGRAIATHRGRHVRADGRRQSRELPGQDRKEGDRRSPLQQLSSVHCADRLGCANSRPRIVQSARIGFSVGPGRRPWRSDPHGEKTETGGQGSAPGFPIRIRSPRYGPAGRHTAPPCSGRWILLGAVGVLVAGGLLFRYLPPQRAAEAPAPPAVAAKPASAPAQYAGGQACATCHAQQYAAWRGSHHDQAMQEANEHTVLGDFAKAKLAYAGITSTLLQRATASTTSPPMVRMESSRTTRSSTPSASTPLQQYLIDFPAADCRRSASPGIRARRRPAARAGSICIRRNGSSTTIRCTGRDRSELELSCARSATRRT